MSQANLNRLLYQRGIKFRAIVYLESDRYLLAFLPAPVCEDVLILLTPDSLIDETGLETYTGTSSSEAESELVSSSIVNRLKTTILSRVAICNQHLCGVFSRQPSEHQYTVALYRLDRQIWPSLTGCVILRIDNLLQSGTSESNFDGSKYTELLGSIQVHISRLREALVVTSAIDIETFAPTLAGNLVHSIRQLRSLTNILENEMSRYRTSEGYEANSNQEQQIHAGLAMCRSSLIGFNALQSKLLELDVSANRVCAGIAVYCLTQPMQTVDLPDLHSPRFWGLDRILPLTQNYIDSNPGNVSVDRVVEWMKSDLAQRHIMSSEGDFQQAEDIYQAFERIVIS